MTIRKRNKKEKEEVTDEQQTEETSPLSSSKDESAKEYPPTLTSDSNKKSPSAKGKAATTNNGLLISVRLDVYHNLQNIRQTITSLTVDDITSLPLRLYNMFFDRQSHVDKSLKGICLLWFYMIVAMAFFTRFYMVTQPPHVW